MCKRREGLNEIEKESDVATLKNKHSEVTDTNELVKENISI